MHTTEFQYIQSNQNSKIFLAHYLPVNQRAGTNKTSAVILVPPFAEEMNRSKRMYVLCARMLANSGMHAICFDFSGTGDSTGGWGDFTYKDWVNDLSDVYQYTSSYADEINFIALRFGALVLMDMILDDQLRLKKCLLWDPIESGQVLTRQFVRMKIAAAMADTSKKITTQQVLQEMSDDGYLESSGYHITRSMFDDINTKNVANVINDVLKQVNIDWMTTGKFKQAQNKWLANSFKQSDIQSDNINMHAVNDVKFWMQQEVTISPQLLKLTREVLING